MIPPFAANRGPCSCNARVNISSEPKASAALFASIGVLNPPANLEAGLTFKFGAVFCTKGTPCTSKPGDIIVSAGGFSFISSTF